MSVSEPATGQQQPPGSNGQGAAAAAGVAGAVGVGAAGAGAASAAMATVGAATIVASLVTFLALLREAHRRWLTRELGRFSSTPDDIAAVIADEMRREELFAQASADRLATALPGALAIGDPEKRAAAVRALLANEERYAQQREEAMAARAIAAVTRAQLRRDSPLGALWRLGQAKDHTPGCRIMAGGDHAGASKFWPWAVLDRVHPPRHYGCTSTLHSFGEAVHNGWMSPGDVPAVRDAIRAAAGVVMELGQADALLREVELRERLIAAGMDGDALAMQVWEGVSVETLAAAGISTEEAD